MRLLFIMDPPATVVASEDTSFGLMLEAERRGHALFHAGLADLYAETTTEGDRIGVRARAARCDPEASPPLSLGAGEDLDLGSLDVVFVRKDPPFDDAYLFATLLLERARGEVLIVNDPRGLRDANEKLYTLAFAPFMPETLVSNDKARLTAFAARVGGRAVIKPLDGAGGDGVFALTVGDSNFNAVIEAVTRGGRRLAMAQRFLPEIADGDKRILLLDGEPLGAIKRVPSGGDLRSNIHVGGRVEAATLDARDRAICEVVGPRLVRDGLYFVGLDVIGGHLTEVNVTSPTGIRQMSRLDGVSYEARVVDWLEARVGA